jgi:hypothetical protein
MAGQCYKIQVGGFMGSTGVGVINVFNEPATGACCFSGGECLETTAAGCAELGGKYQGDNVPCFSRYAFGDCNSVFEDISGTGTLAPIASRTADGGDADVPIGFSFDFFNESHTTIGIASNGYLTFGATLADFTNDAIPDPASPNDLIAPY